jgi:hypothetical protein
MLQESTRSLAVANGPASQFVKEQQKPFAQVTVGFREAIN